MFAREDRWHGRACGMPQPLSPTVIVAAADYRFTETRKIARAFDSLDTLDEPMPPSWWQSATRGTPGSEACARLNMSTKSSGVGCEEVSLASLLAIACWGGAAALHGDAVAHRILAGLYADGRFGIPVDPVKAVFHGQKAEAIGAVKKWGRKQIGSNKSGQVHLPLWEVNLTPLRYDPVTL